MSAENIQIDPNDKQEDREQPKKEFNYMDSGFPLLKEFREKAPGSHKHAQSLVGIVENVCSAIDLDPDTLKVAAMYHDIGKMWAPELYTENQGKENIHDKLDPWISYQLITRHVSDTVAILVANDFPKEVIKIASQHHGRCALQNLMEKPKSAGHEDINAFRYKTCRPDSLESLILMLCDQAEATSRSVYTTQGLSVEPEVLIMNLYNKLHADGQFDNVQVVLGKLKKVQHALISDVASSFQKRVKYDEDGDLIEEA